MGEIGLFEATDRIQILDLEVVGRDFQIGEVLLIVFMYVRLWYDRNPTYPVFFIPMVRS